MAKKSGGRLVVEKASFEKRKKRTITRGTVGLFMFRFYIEGNPKTCLKEISRWEEVPGVTTYGLAERWAKARAKSLNAKRVILDADNH